MGRLFDQRSLPGGRPLRVVNQGIGTASKGVKADLIGVHIHAVHQTAKRIERILVMGVRARPAHGEAGRVPIVQQAAYCTVFG